jgi:hypothetical protein
VRHGRDFQEAEKSSIAVLDKATGKHRIILEGARMARYGGGRLVFLRGNDVFTVPFDAERLAITGPATAVAERIVTHPSGSFADFDVSPGGTLTFLEGSPVEGHISAVLHLDRSGNERVIPVPTGQYMSPRISPDGRRLALIRYADGRGDLVVYDQDRSILTAFTPEPGRYFSPVWSPDGSRMGFARFQIGNPTLCVKRSDGEGDIGCLTRPSEDPAFASDWSPDGATIAYTVLHTSTSERDPTRAAFTSDIWLIGADGEPAARPLFEAPFRESAAVFSPDGKWTAYVSDESGDDEVFIRRSGDSGARVKVSSSAGSEPAWSRGGRELVYRTGHNSEKFMAVAIATTPTLTISPARLLFTATVDSGNGIDAGRGYDVSPDGNDFFGAREVSRAEPERRLVVITDWASTLPR